MTLIAASPGGITMPPDLSVWGTVVITAVFATALAFVVQTWAQKLVSPANVAVVLTMEPVFAGVFGVLLGGNAAHGAYCLRIHLRAGRDADCAAKINITGKTK